MIQQSRVETIDKLLMAINVLSNSYMYRGHADSSWRLQSTLERLGGANFGEAFVDRWEQYSLATFKAKFHIYDTQNKTPESKLEWLSLMQHYGVPTRLLDFTTSPYVALYFAIEHYEPSTGKDLSLFAIDYDAMMDVSFGEIKKIDRSFSYDNTTMSLDGRQDKVFEETVDKFSYPILWGTEPSKLNVRIDRQSGCFLLTGRKSLTIEDAIAQPIYNQTDARKIDIAPTLFESIYALLRKMNISAKTIYGDLSGLARSLQAEARMHTYAPPRTP